MFDAVFSNLKQRVLFLVTVGILSVGLSGLISLFFLKTDIDNYGHLVAQDLSAAQKADVINLNFKRQVQEWKNVLLRGHDTQRREKYWSSFNRYHQLVQLQASEFMALDIDDQFKREMTTFRDEHLDMKDKYETGFKAFVDSGFSHKVGDKAVSGIDRAPSQRLEKLTESLTTAAALVSQHRMDNAAKTLRLGGVSIIVLTILSLLAVGWFISAKVVGPLVYLINHLRSVEAGKLETKVEIYSRDEIGILSKTIEKLRQSLIGLRSQMEDNQVALSQVSGNLSGGADDISSGVQSQQQGVNSAASVVSSLTERSAAIADYTNQALDSAKAMAEDTENGIQIMASAVSALSSSSQQIQETAAVIGNLESDAQRIGSVLDVIKGIAEQTNLLALNAAIEAARAGEQGRGFAVVADEVRSLAAKTQQSTEEIHEMITSVQTGTGKAVAAIESGQKTSSESQQRISDADHYLHNIAKKIQDISSVNQQISEGVGEQRKLTSDVHHHIQEVARIADSNETLANKTRDDSASLLSVSERVARALRRLQGVAS